MNLIHATRATATAIPFQNYQVGDHRIICPSCGDRKRDKTLGLTINSDGTGVAHCFRCSLTETYRPREGAALKTASIKPVRLSSEKRTTLSPEGLTIWNECLPISGTARNYLEYRGCVIPPEDGHLRWHPNLRHSRGYQGPALVGLVTNIMTSEPMSLHMTWITNTTKAPIEPYRKFLVDHALSGGCIRLWSDDSVTMSLGVAEGIETALSIAHAVQPVWALMNAGHMANFPVLPGLEGIFIAVDQDSDGRNAAATLADRYLQNGIQVFQTVQPKGDANDHVRGLR